MGVPVTIADRSAQRDPEGDAWPASPLALPQADLVLDALVGYSLRGAPRGATAALIETANALPAPVLALDVPSGLDATTGQTHRPSIHATATLTLALPKTGLRTRAAAGAVGDLYLADISVPPALYAQPTLDLPVPPLFARGDVLWIEGR
jgi:NAD(P)H-hydrate epimerase